MVDQLNAFASKLTRGAREFGTKASSRCGQAEVPEVAPDTGRTSLKPSNSCVESDEQVRNIAEVATATRAANL